MIKVPASGPTNARIMIVGEAPGRTEVEEGRPFVGASGIELTRMLHEAGILRTECFITNVCKYQPPGNKIEAFFGNKKEGLSELSGQYPRQEILEGLQELHQEIEQVQPGLILALGNVPMWALTGKWGITNWRGSILKQAHDNCSPGWLLPAYHPAAILRNWEWRFITVQDFKRAKKLLDGRIKEPQYNFIVSPEFPKVMEILAELIAKAESPSFHISVDLETRRGQIACVALAWSATKAICIPFLDLRKENKSYWTLEEEVAIILRLQTLLTSPFLMISGQNFVYDTQYIAKEWGVLPRLWRDTMLIHHTMFPGTPKALDYLSSLYLDWHVFWKHESKEWEKGIPEDDLWIYNCKDAVVTWEIAEEQTNTLNQVSLKSSEYGRPDEIQMSLVPIVLETMLRGVKIDTEKKKQLILDLDEAVRVRQEWVNFVIKGELNVRSPKQLQALFYEELGQKVIIKYKTGRPTTDGDALLDIVKREPLLGPLVARINEMRQLLAAQSFCAQPLDIDKRMRCSYNVGGTETFRFSSSEDAFGFGTNLQNVTSGEEEKDEHGAFLEGGFRIPNLRTIFTPDRGFSLGEFDLTAADAQVVAAEAGEWTLLDQLRDPVFNLHDFNAARWGIGRQTAKSAVHGTNYGAEPFALVKNLGLKRGLAEDIQKDWLARYPGIEEWHKRIERQLMTKRYIENRFGYRRFYFDRLDDLLKEALAWIPQSTVAIVTNLGIRKVKRRYPLIQFLLQNHDAAAFQWPSHQTETPKQIYDEMHINIPYERPLIIDVKVKTSDKSWGDCH